MEVHSEFEFAGLYWRWSQRSLRLKGISLDDRVVWHCGVGVKKWICKVGGSDKIHFYRISVDRICRLVAVAFFKTIELSPSLIKWPDVIANILIFPTVCCRCVFTLKSGGNKMSRRNKLVFVVSFFSSFPFFGSSANGRDVVDACGIISKNFSHDSTTHYIHRSYVIQLPHSLCETINNQETSNSVCFLSSVPVFTTIQISWFAIFSSFRRVTNELHLLVRRIALNWIRFNTPEHGSITVSSSSIDFRVLTNWRGDAVIRIPYSCG